MEKREADGAGKTGARTEATQQAIFKAVPVVVSVLSVDRKMKFNNERIVDLLGYSLEELHNSSTRILYFNDEEFEAAGRALYADRKRLAGGSRGVETRMRHKDGHVLYVSLSAALLDVNDPNSDLVATIQDITSRKTAEEALEKRLVALTKPLDSKQAIEFDELFNIADIQRLQDEFCEATGVASVIVRPDGSPLTRPSHFCRLCTLIRTTEIGRANCYKSDAAIGGCRLDGPAIQPCLSGGLWDAGSAITVGGQHIASWLIGQVRNEAQDEERILAYVREIGADEDEARKAFYEVPAMSQERFSKISHMLFTLAQQLSSIAYQNVQQARFITERKRVLEILQASEEKFRRLIDTTDTGFVIIGDDSGRVIEANDNYLKLCGRNSLSEIIGHSSVEWTAPYDRERDVMAMKACFLDGKVRNLTLDHQTPDGRIIAIEVNAAALPLNDGIALYALCRDVTEKRAQTAHLQHQQKLEAIGTLAGGVAHEINNPINIIMNYAELIASDSEPESQVCKDALAIVRESQRIAAIVKNLLAFSRQENERHSPAQMTEIIASTLSLTGKLLAKDQIIVKTESTPDLPKLKCRSQQIMQVLMNLVTNARDAMNERFPRDSPEKILCIKSELVQHDGRRWILVSVEDHGAGIPETVKGRIFDPFFTSKPKDKGTGLGLAISHGIVKEHHGRMWFESNRGEGSVFYFELPVDNGWTIGAGDEQALRPDDTQTH